MINLLIDTSLRVFYSIEPGKPSPKESLVKGAPDTRSRVFQSQQKMETCTYYAANILRKRYGPKSVGFDRERDIEFKSSALRKKITELQTIIYGNIALSEAGLKNTLLEANLHMLMASISEKDKKELAASIEIIEGYLNQTQFTTFREYVLHENWVRAIPLYHHFLESMGTSLVELCFLAYMKPLFTEKPRLESQYHQSTSAEKKKLQDNFQTQVLDPQFSEAGQQTLCSTAQGYAEKFMLDSYGFKDTDVNSIDELLESLRTNGPLLVLGPFGKNFYKKEAKEVATLQGFSILGWKSEDRKPDEELDLLEFHAIVVLGALKGGPKGGYIYYVDPIDDSPPGVNRKVYVTTFEKFMKYKEHDCLTKLHYYPNSKA